MILGPGATKGAALLTGMSLHDVDNSPPKVRDQCCVTVLVRALHTPIVIAASAALAM